METIDIIAGTSLFSGVPRPLLEKVEALAVHRRYDRGETLFLEGDDAAGLYLVSTGRVKIYKLSPDGREQALRVFGPGDCVGEVPMFAGTSFPAYCDAIEETGVLFIPREGFLALIRTEPDLSVNMLRVLGGRLLYFTRMVEDLSLKEVPQRMAAYLVDLVERGGGASDIDLDISKTLLARLLGSTSETVSRTFARMVRDGLIALDGRRLTILDTDALDALARGDRLL